MKTTKSELSARIRQLSQRDSLLMAKTLLHPPEPNEKLKALFNEVPEKVKRK